VVWRHFDRRISFVVITEAGNGLTSITRSVQYVGPPRPPEPVPADHAQCVVALAGRAAETIRYPGLQRAELVELSGSDQAQAAVLIRELRGSSISDNEISAEIAALEAEALQILRQEWAAVDALAAALLAHPEHALDGDEAMTRAYFKTRHEFSKCKMFAVGNRVAPVPPHRSGRAQLRHPAPTRSIWRQAAYRCGSSHATQRL
jgi:hypothetical protein